MVEVVAMVGFPGFTTAASQKLSNTMATADPFHVAGLAGDALDKRRQRRQKATLWHRERLGDSLYGARRSLHTSVELLAQK
jgi:transposase